MMYLGIFAFFATVSYTIAGWDHGYFHARCQRQDDLHEFGNLNHNGHPGPHGLHHHPRWFGIHYHHHPKHFETNPGFHPPPHDKFHPHPSTNFDRNDKFGHNFEDFDTDFDNNEKDFEDQSNSFTPDQKDFNEDEERQNKPWPTPNRWYWNGQRWVFPENDVFTRPQPTTTTSRPAVTNAPLTTTTTPTSASPLAISVCMRSCPVTSEYNPVCGSNNVTYNNPGRLECAKNCGVDVTMTRASSCPRPTPPPDTSSPPNQVSTTTIKNVPTRFTTIDINGNAGNSGNSGNVPGGTSDTASTTFPVHTIPSDVLDNIFTKPATTTVDDEDIDIRFED